MYRFWSKVDKNGPIPLERPDLGPCWVWLAAKFSRGYGAFRYNGKQRKAHTIAWELVNEKVSPPDLVPDHLCRNTCCVNPNHLEWVTNKVNILRGNSFTAKNAMKTQCHQGHPFTEENTRTYNGHRQCRACGRIWMQKFREKVKKCLSILPMNCQS